MIINGTIVLCVQFQDECVFINHGAFGGVLKDALETAQVYLGTDRTTCIPYTFILMMIN